MCSVTDLSKHRDLRYLNPLEAGYRTGQKVAGGLYAAKRQNGGTIVNRFTVWTSTANKCEQTLFTCVQLLIVHRDRRNCRQLWGWGPLQHDTVQQYIQSTVSTCAKLAHPTLSSIKHLDDPVNPRAGTHCLRHKSQDSRRYCGEN